MAFNGTPSDSYGVSVLSCLMGSHSVTCHPRQV